MNEKPKINEEISKIMYAMGFSISDPHKVKEIKGYVEEAEEFMISAGVAKEKITTQSAYAIKHIWANARNSNTALNLVQKDGMIVHLISQLRGGRNGK